MAGGLMFWVVLNVRTLVSVQHHVHGCENIQAFDSFWFP